MQRSTFLGASMSLAGSGLVPRAARAATGSFDPQPGLWRTYAITTELRLAHSGPSRAWVPVPALATGWLRPGTTTWRTNASAARVVGDPQSGARMVALEWTAPAAFPVATIRSEVSTRDRNVDLGMRDSNVSLAPQERRRYTASTRWIPTGGIVAATARRITAGSGGDLEAARRIYDWIVANTYRDPATRGCGSGDAVALLTSGHLGGKCADLNGLYVALARAAGLPARDLYGIRVAPSRFGYRSLGANSATITAAQHCRAEVFLDRLGWVPVDPADVRKVMLEEPPGNLPLSDPKVAAANRTLFGAWEGNWIAYNDASGVDLAGAAQPAIAFLMYPQAENAGVMCDCLDPNAVRYTITAQPLTA